MPVGPGICEAFGNTCMLKPSLIKFNPAVDEWGLSAKCCFCLAHLVILYFLQSLIVYDCFIDLVGQSIASMY